MLPQKRGPHYQTRHKTRRIPQTLQNKIVALRQKGLNRYEIHAELRQDIQNLVPCPSTIYNVCKRYGLNRKTPTMKKKAQMIIKEKAGMLGHIDYDYLPQGIIYQKGLLKMINSIACEYGIRFNEILTDNGAEFGSGPMAKNKGTNPF